MIRLHNGKMLEKALPRELSRKSKGNNTNGSAGSSQSSTSESSTGASETTESTSDGGPSASSQESIPLDEEEVFAEEFNHLQGGGPSYPSSLSSMSQTWMY